MKNLKVILVFAILSLLGASAFAENGKKTESIKVYGNCEMCKSRIEKAARIDGVTSADWVVKTKMLTVTYDPSKTSLDAIAKKIAAAGHDNDKIKASAEAYSKLPGCCHYERK